MIVAVGGSGKNTPPICAAPSTASGAREIVASTLVRNSASTNRKDGWRFRRSDAWAVPSKIVSLAATQSEILSSVSNVIS
ncbi:hypothetical protein JEY30_12330 [Bradyrhizobium japonicum]|nr:hypothetical protein JEY30_12330 [Bradyrhizobium japonicum]